MWHSSGSIRVDIGYHSWCFQVRYDVCALNVALSERCSAKPSPVLLLLGVWARGKCEGASDVLVCRKISAISGRKLA